MEQAYQVGAVGIVSGVAAALPGLVTQVWDELKYGNFDAAKTLVKVSQAFHRRSTIVAARMILEEQGIRAGSCLLPLSGATEEDRRHLINHLRELGIRVEKTVL